MLTETSVYNNTDDVTGNVMIDVWTNTGGDLHILLLNVDTQESQSVYLRNGEELAKAILKEAWK